MSELGDWLANQIQKRGLTQNAVAAYAEVGQGTVSDIINKGHIPKVDTLFRLADYFDVSREQVLRLAGHLPPHPLVENYDLSIRVKLQQLAEIVSRLPPSLKERTMDQLINLAEFVESAGQDDVDILGPTERRNATPEKA